MFSRVPRASDGRCRPSVGGSNAVGRSVENSARAMVSSFHHTTRTTRKEGERQQEEPLLLLLLLLLRHKGIDRSTAA